MFKELVVSTQLANTSGEQLTSHKGLGAVGASL